MLLNSVTLEAKLLGVKNKDLKLEFLEYPHIVIPSRTLAFNLQFKEESSDELTGVRADVANYNDYVKYIISIDGFIDEFKANNWAITKDKVLEKWGSEVCDKVFSLENYIFETQLFIVDDCLINRDALWNIK